MNLPIFLRKLIPIPKVIKLNWDLAAVERSYQKEIYAASKLNDREKVRDLKESQRWEVALIEEEIDHHQTQQILRKARKLKVPVSHRTTSDPEGDEFWTQGHQTGNWYLTTKGYSNLRLAIRNELKERHEMKAHWVVWLSALTGLVGTCTGLLAVFNKSG
ncbi:hypothetical protein EBI01_19415 [Marinomonas rhizomae]|uniref:Uncharacterized protein n=1 Tax=Marinomonas rhizomae TaxID=491948 RepID=A0A366J0P2_9GAMM|nr:hypothetical protein [Marinomonas rhizomae]RBP80633.1 hypothetical protein DFP80_111158 [Marinomonas rhizomae]RNF69073.1 hypothetical protein EBI01_19415 [Marinomonas rhizomae]